MSLSFFFSFTISHDSSYFSFPVTLSISYSHFFPLFYLIFCAYFSRSISFTVTSISLFIFIFIVSFTLFASLYWFVAFTLCLFLLLYSSFLSHFSASTVIICIFPLSLFYVSNLFLDFFSTLSISEILSHFLLFPELVFHLLFPGYIPIYFSFLLEI